MLSSVAKILAAAAAMGLVCAAVARLSPSRAVNILAGVPLGAAVFYICAAGLGLRELTDARDALLKKLR
jgi:hypothetical protein